MAPRKRTAKAADKAKLKDRRTVTLTFEASEEFMQRLAALMIFAAPATEEQYVPTLLPWEDPDDPRFQKPPELQVDYNSVRNEIVRHLEVYIARHGADATKAFVKSFGADRLRDIPEKNLLPLEEGLRLALKLDGPDAKR